MAAIARLGAPSGEPNAADLDGWVKVEGSPSMRTWVQHATADGTAISGTWEATVGAWHATFAFYEFAHIIEGRLTITEDGGEPVSFGPGDALAVEAGFRGVWRIEEPVHKHLAIRLK